MKTVADILNEKKFTDPLKRYKCFILLQTFQKISQKFFLLLLTFGGTSRAAIKSTGSGVENDFLS
jgi:hypothetical protein